MARTTPEPQLMSRAGLVPVFAAAPVDGIKMACGHSLAVANASGDDITVTFQTPGTNGLVAIDDTESTAIDGETTWFSRFPAQYYGRTDAGNRGLVYVDFSDVTGVTIAVAYRGEPPEDIPET